MHDIQLPHHRLKAYEIALKLLDAIKAAKIRDPYLRDHAIRSGKSAALNCAEGAGRMTRADKAVAFKVARGEAGEAAASTEIAVRAGDAEAAALPLVLDYANQFIAMMTALMR